MEYFNTFILNMLSQLEQLLPKVTLEQINYLLHKQFFFFGAFVLKLHACITSALHYCDFSFRKLCESYMYMLSHICTNVKYITIINMVDIHLWKPGVRPGAWEESASPAWLATPAWNVHIAASLYI